MTFKMGEPRYPLGNFLSTIVLHFKKNNKIPHMTKTSNPAITKQRFLWTNFHAFTSDSNTCDKQKNTTQPECN